MDIKKIQHISATEMNQVNTLITAQLSSDVALINQLGFYIINSGGKRIRPLITILAAKALGIPQPCCTMMWSMTRICAAEKKQRMRYLARQPVY